MNEDELYDAAEREMDLYRAEITRITAERDQLREQLAATKTVLQETSRESSQRGEQVRLAREDRDQLRKAVLDLAAEYGDATEDDEVEGHVPGSLYMAIRAELLNAAAARLRQVAEPPS